MISENVKYFTGNTKPTKNCIPISKGEGIYFWDISGKKYTDMASQTFNLLLGQCYPSVVNAVVEQVKTLTYATSRFGSSAYFKAVGKLMEIAPKNFTNVNIRMCDGSDANETGVKIARKYTGKETIISFKYAHTGQTTQTIQLRGYDRDERLLIGNHDNVVFVNPPKCKDHFDYESTINELNILVKENKNIAGMLIDPIMVNAGVLLNAGTREYLQKVNELCRQNDIILILDESQSFGWLDGIFATNYFNIDPDIITLGKGLSSGYPLAGIIVKDYLKDVLGYNEAEFTNGGHAVSCSAAYECIVALQKNDFMIEQKGSYIKQKIKQIKTLCNINYTNRGVGLIHCIEITEGNEKVNKEIAEKIFYYCLDHGLLLRQFNCMLVLKPPIIINFDQIDEAFEIIFNAFTNLEKI